MDGATELEQAESKPALNRNPVTLKAGDKVRTNYLPEERHVVRTLTSLTPSLLAEGGLASADGGEDNGGGTAGTPIEGVAAAWFLPVDRAAKPGEQR